jgi:hypothetical protein
VGDEVGGEWAMSGHSLLRSAIVKLFYNPDMLYNIQNILHPK